MFNKDWKTLVSNFQNTSGNFGDKVLTIFNSNDTNCLKEYNRQIQAGIKPSIAYKNTMMDCSKEAKKNAVSIAKGTISYKDATKSLKGLSFGAKAANLAMSALSMAGNLFVSWAVTKGIQLAVTAISNYINRVEIAKEKTIELLDEYENITSEISTLESKLEELNAQIKGLDPITDEQDIKNLKLETAELNAQLAILKEKQAIAKQDAEDAATESLSMEQSSKYAFDDKTYVDYFTGTTYNGKSNRKVTSYQELDLAMDAYEEYANKVLELQEELSNLEESDPEYTKKATEIQDWSNKMKDARSHANELATSIQSQVDALPEGSQLKKDVSGVIEEYLKWINGINGATDALEENGNAIKENGSNVEFLSVSETVSALNNNLKPAIDSISEAYHDIFTEDGFTRENIGLDMFDSIQKELDELSEAGINVDYSSFENLIKVLEDTESSTDDIEDAFDEVAYAMANAALSGIEDFETLKNALQELGYTNYEITAFESLVNNKDALLKAGLDLETATKKEIVAFASEMVSVENLAQAVNILTFEKEMSTLQDMNTSKEVAHLKTLAENAGYTGDIIEYLTELEKIYQEVSSGTLDPHTIQDKLDRAKELKGLIEAEAAKINFAPKAENQDWKPFQKASNKSASKAGKSAAEEYKEALEKELSDLDTVLGFITDTIQEQIDSYGDLKDAAVDSLTAQKEAAEEALEAEKELIQAQIDAIQDRIDAKQDEIDAIQDARKEREANIDLMKKEYELQRLQNQNTQLVKLCQTL